MSKPLGRYTYDVYSLPYTYFIILCDEVNMKNEGGLEESIELVELVGMEVQRDGKICVEGEVHEEDLRTSTIVDPLIQQTEASTL